MPRKPNYRFDRMERDRAKAAKRAERQKSKDEKAAGTEPEPDAEVAHESGAEQPTHQDE